MAAANLCIKLAKRRAELVGLDREVKIQVDARQVTIASDHLKQVVALSQDPEAAAALEKVAAMFAHGEEAVDAEWEEEPDGEAED